MDEALQEEANWLNDHLCLRADNAYMQKQQQQQHQTVIYNVVNEVANAPLSCELNYFTR